MKMSIVQPKWKITEYSRSQIINAGKTVRDSDPSDNEIAEAIKIIDNWRAAHAFPLHVIYIHLRKMKNKRNDVIVAERLKRLDSIVKKLKRESKMSLWTMQDLGGCRVVVPTIDEVYSFAEKYEDSRKRHIRKKTYDYIKSPKQSGYRSLHVVYEYKSDRRSTYNQNMLIEIQFRTHLQHVWATAVETMGIFTKEAIKSGQGPEDVKRFFILVSSLFALEEGQPIVPNVIDDKDEIIHEIESLNAKHNYLDFLSGIRVATDNQQKNRTEYKTGYCILILNYTNGNLSRRYFKTSQFNEANEIYNSIERTNAGDKIDAVLVRASSFNELKSAYPNYFSDIREFVTRVKRFLQ